MSLRNICAYPHFKAAGVKTDCEKLLCAFQQTQSVRFTEFAKLWRERQFSFIFGGRISEKELMEFTEECLLIALAFALPPHPFQWRTGGLYLMYALYFKQPQKYKVPIRVTLENWVDLQEYIKEVKEQTHHDIHYVFRMLEMSNAFQFVAFHIEHSPMVHQGVLTDSISPSVAKTSSVMQLVEDGFLQHLEQLQKTYTYMKSEVVNDDSISSISKDLYTDISSAIKDFEAQRARNEGTLVFGKQADADEQDDDDSGDEYGGDIGAHRRALKEKSLHQTASTRRSRRNRAVVVDNAPSTSSASKKARKGTRKAVNRRRSANQSGTAFDSGDYDHEDEPYASFEIEASGPALSMPILANVNREESLPRGARRKET